MKLNRLFIASLLGFSLLTTSALACQGSSHNSSQESHWSFFGWCHHTDRDSHRQCDHDGQDTGRGNNCDRGKGNDGGHCSTGGTSTGSTGSTGSGYNGKGISN